MMNRRRRDPSRAMFSAQTKSLPKADMHYSTYKMRLLVIGYKQMITAQELQKKEKGTSFGFQAIVVDTLEGSPIDAATGKRINEYTTVYKINSTIGGGRKVSTGENIQLFLGNTVYIKFHIKDTSKDHFLQLRELRNGMIVEVEGLQSNIYTDKKTKQRKLEWKCFKPVMELQVFKTPGATFKLFASLPQTLFPSYIERELYQKLHALAELKITPESIKLPTPGPEDNPKTPEELEKDKNKLLLEKRSNFERDKVSSTLLSGMLSTSTIQSRSVTRNDILKFREITGDDEAWLMWGLKVPDTIEELASCFTQVKKDKDGKDETVPLARFRYNFILSFKDPNGVQKKHRYDLIVNVYRRFSSTPLGMVGFTHEILQINETSVWEAVGPHHAYLVPLTMLVFNSEPHSKTSRKEDTETEEGEGAENQEEGDDDYDEDFPDGEEVNVAEVTGPKEPELPKEDGDGDGNGDGDGDGDGEFQLPVKTSNLHPRLVENLCSWIEYNDEKQEVPLGITRKQLMSKITDEYTLEFSAGNISSGLAGYLIERALSVSHSHAGRLLKGLWSYKPQKGAAVVSLFKYEIDKKTGKMRYGKNFYDHSQHEKFFKDRFKDLIQPQVGKVRGACSLNGPCEGYDRGVINVGEIPYEAFANPEKHVFKILTNILIEPETYEALSKFPIEEQEVIVEELIEAGVQGALFNKNALSENAQKISALGFVVPQGKAFKFAIYSLMADEIPLITAPSTGLNLPLLNICPPKPIRFPSNAPHIDHHKELLSNTHITFGDIFGELDAATAAAAAAANTTTPATADVSAAAAADAPAAASSDTATADSATGDSTQENKDDSSAKENKSESSPKQKPTTKDETMTDANESEDNDATTANNNNNDGDAAASDDDDDARIEEKPKGKSSGKGKTNTKSRQSSSSNKGGNKGDNKKAPKKRTREEFNGGEEDDEPESQDVDQHDESQMMLSDEEPVRTPKKPKRDNNSSKPKAPPKPRRHH